MTRLRAMRTAQRGSARSAALVIVVLLSACASGPAPRDHFYRVELAPPARSLESPLLDGILEVSRFRLDSLSDGRDLVYRSDADAAELQRFAYHRWVDPPSAMLQGEIASYLGRAGVAQAVVTSDIRIDAAYALDGRILRYEIVLGGPGEVRLELEFGVTDQASRDLLFLGSYAVARPFPPDDLEAAARAYSDALEEILQQFVEDWAASRTR
jgi:cholesterol transport system auxiliary component